MPQYPSERVKSGAKARVRSHSVKVWRCITCGKIYDNDPNYKAVGSFSRKPCKKCGSEVGYKESRVKD